ncbi:MAG: tRNA lysidine(34) synthetase TilS [Parachlamydiales bacterium]|jgi:tRNA(Ile)-lysidine synthase
MSEKLVQKLRDFFLPRAPFSGPLILAYSGGFDSKALLYLLLEVKKKVALDLVLAHVDHGWREESAGEAESLKLEAGGLHLPFFCKKLEGAAGIKNQEAFCRRLRLEFFFGLYQSLNASALLFAHQKDEQAETTLKRFFEGADLPFLGGMEEESLFMGMRVFRPLLEVSKKALLAFLDARGLQAISDRTNFDSRYLRGRMRNELIPVLATAFGRPVLENLAVASERFRELKAYLEKRVSTVFQRARLSSFGLFLDLQKQPLEPLELRYLIKKLLLLVGFDLSRGSLKRLVLAREEGRRLRQVLKEGELVLDRDRLFFIKKSAFSFFQTEIPLREGRWEEELFCLEVKPAVFNGESSNLFNLPSWQEWLISGRLNFFLPKAPGYSLRGFQPGLRLFHRRFCQYLAEKGVPAFLRTRLPLVFQGGKPFCDLLSGQALFPRFAPQKTDEYYQVDLIFK